MSAQHRQIARLVVRRWLLGVFLVGSVVPLGLLAVRLATESGVHLTSELIVGRGELFLVSGSAVLTAIISCLDGRPDQRLSSEAVLLLVVFVVLPCFAIWANGVGASLMGPTAEQMTSKVSVEAGRATAIVCQLVAFGLLLRHARFEVLKGGLR